jgi:hypothetical protein
MFPLPSMKAFEILELPVYFEALRKFTTPDDRKQAANKIIRLISRMERF